jgi:putative restriction endonuclease
MKEAINQASRAKIAWGILTELASQREEFTYGELTHQMQLHHRSARFFLDLIMKYCQEHNLPPLTILVVNQTGKPGNGFTATDLRNFDPERERVYNFDWAQIAHPFEDAE